MSTGALQCLSSTVCVSLPEPIHPCTLLPPSDPDVAVFPDIYNRIQQFKLTKPTWTDYTERCLGGAPGTTEAVTADPITTTEAETTSVFHTVTQTLTEAVTNVTSTVTADRGASSTGGDTASNWVIPVVVVTVIIVVVIILVVTICIYKKCYHAKSSTKERFNSYHDMYVVEGPSETPKGVNSEKVMENRKEIEKPISVSLENEASPKKKVSGETSDSGITCEIQSQISQFSGNTGKSEEHLVEQDDNKLCPEADVVISAVDNKSFLKDNGDTEHQTQHLTMQTSSIDVQNGSQQTPISDQREQDISETASVEQTCVSSQMGDGQGDKDKVQPESNNSDSAIIRETSHIKNNSSSHPSNYTDPKPYVNNVDSQGSSDIEDTDVSNSRTPEYENMNSNRLQKHPDSAIKSLPLTNGFNGTQEMDQKFDHSSEDQLIPNGATSPGVKGNIKLRFDADVTDHTDDLGTDNGNDGTVDMRHSNGHSDPDNIRMSGDLRLSNGHSDTDSIRTSGTNDSRKSDLRSDLVDIINSSLL